MASINSNPIKSLKTTTNMTSPSSSSSDFEYRPWSNLFDLLPSISSRLPHIVDYIQFRSVCPTWRSSAAPTDLPPQLPCLLLPHDPASSSRKLFDLSYSPHYSQIFTFDSHEPQNRIVCGSAFGFLALLDADSALSLWNPFSRSLVRLPRPTSLPSYLGFHVHRYTRPDPGHKSNVDIFNSPDNFGNLRKGYPWKVSLSAHPSDKDCVVTVVLTDSLEFAFCRIGDEAWSTVDTKLVNIVSVLFRKGKFYVFDKTASGVVIDSSTDHFTYFESPKLSEAHDADPEDTELSHFYVAVKNAKEDEAEELLMVVFFEEDEPVGYYLEDEGVPVEVMQCALKMAIFKLEEDEGEYIWAEAYTLGNSAIFLSGNHASVVDARGFDGLIKEGCIYFSYLYGCPRGNHNLQPGVHYIY